MNLRLGTFFTIAAFLTLPSRIAAQAFTLPQRVGAVTLAWQYVDNTGHRFSDGFFLARGESVSMSALIEVDYGVTDRFSVTAAIPYVFAKYTGAMPPPSRLPVDECACWHSSFQDLSLAARYRFGDDTRAVTPLVRYVLPVHDYPYVGEAVVGRRLREAQVGVNAGVRLSGALRNVSFGSGYTYSFVEKPLADISIDKSNGFVDLGFAVGDRLYLRTMANWQQTHGGLRIGSPTGNPFFPPGELNTPERFAQRDRLLSTQYWQAGAGVAYSMERFDVFGSVAKYVWGRNAHNGWIYTVGSTWYFDRR